MQPNVIVADAISHRARFAWLSLALAATLTLLVASPLARGSHARSAPAPRSLYQDHGCTAHRWPAHLKAEQRAHREAERAEHRALRDAARAERRALREAERAERRARFAFFY